MILGLQVSWERLSDHTYTLCLNNNSCACFWLYIKIKVTQTYNNFTVLLNQSVIIYQNFEFLCWCPLHCFLPWAVSHKAQVIPLLRLKDLWFRLVRMWTAWTPKLYNPSIFFSSNSIWGCCPVGGLWPQRLVTLASFAWIKCRKLKALSLIFQKPCSNWKEGDKGVGWEALWQLDYTGHSWAAW